MTRTKALQSTELGTRQFLTTTRQHNSRASGTRNNTKDCKASVSSMEQTHRIPVPMQVQKAITSNQQFLQCCRSGSAWIRIQQKVKEQVNKTVNSGLFVLQDRTVVRNREWQIVDRIFFLTEFKVCFQVFPNIGTGTQLIWVGSRSAWIRNFCPEPENSKLDPDPELIIPYPQHCIFYLYPWSGCRGSVVACAQFWPSGCNIDPCLTSSTPVAC